MKTYQWGEDGMFESDSAAGIWVKLEDARGPDERNLIKKLKDDMAKKKEEHQARVDKMLARMAEMHEQIADQQKTINGVRAQLERAIGHANRLEEDIRTLRVNENVSVDDFVEKLRELEDLLLEGRGDDTVLAAVRFLRRIRGV